MKLLIFCILWIIIHTIWLWVGVSIRRLDLPERTQRRINIVMALAMLGVVVLAAVTASQST